MILSAFGSSVRKLNAIRGHRFECTAFEKVGFVVNEQSSMPNPDGNGRCVRWVLLSMM